jgi:mannitol-specific phosphotransferase system IIBC component
MAAAARAAAKAAAKAAKVSEIVAPAEENEVPEGELTRSLSVACGAGVGASAVGCVVLVL